jgi:hypothetical protein
LTFVGGVNSLIRSAAGDRGGVSGRRARRRQCTSRCGHMPGTFSTLVCALGELRDRAGLNLHRPRELEARTGFAKAMSDRIRAARHRHGAPGLGLRGGRIAHADEQDQLQRVPIPAEIIQQAIWLYLRFTLGLRDIEDLLAERGSGGLMRPLGVG